MANERRPLPASKPNSAPNPQIDEQPGSAPMETQDIALALIEESDRFRVRMPPYPGITELAEDIRKVGLISALVVRPRDDHYELIAGYCRLAALRSLGAPTARCQIYRDLSNLDARRTTMGENERRNTLTDLERAEQCVAAQTDGMTVEEIARYIGWDGERQVYRHLKLAKEATPALRGALQARKLSFTVAIALLEDGIADLAPATQEQMLRTIVEKELSVRDARAHFARAKRGVSDTPPSAAPRPNTPASIREHKNGTIILSARFDPKDLIQLQRAITVVQDAVKRAKTFERKLRAPNMATRDGDSHGSDPAENGALE
jgi:ParB-like chromosome segregation protein Spo0J